MASSSIIILELSKNNLAKATRWRSPPDNLIPFSPNSVSKPFSNFNLSKQTNFNTFSISSSLTFLSNTKFSLNVPSKIGAS